MNLKNCGKFPSDLSDKNRRQNRSWSCFAFILLTLVATRPQSEAATRYVSLSGTHVSPFETWDQAATNIQAAIDVAVVGDEVLVTNGVYATGGKVMAGDLTNRIAIDKAITVRSVNGPVFTIIQGASGPAINGLAAVRCAWLTNDATLSGFTLRGGATRETGSGAELCGGGVWCATNSASIENCYILGNSAVWYGAGAYRGTFLHCRISRNILPASSSFSPEGGGIYDGAATTCEISQNSAWDYGGGISRTMATNCSISRNISYGRGGGASYGVLNHCTVVGNTGTNGVGGTYNSTVVNSIIHGNTPDNYFNAGYGSLQYSCATPLPGGIGNIAVDPQLLPDRIHLAATSPCRGAGTNVTGIDNDIDGQPRPNPPAIGCDEWRPEPVATTQRRPEIFTSPLRFQLSGVVAGQEPFAVQWQKAGQPLFNDGHFSGTAGVVLMITNFALGDKGDYQLVASNAFGVSTSAIYQLDFHCVDAASANPAPPYLTWDTAAARIQDAIDVAAVDAIILATNGIYASGGRARSDGLTNRILVARPMTIAGVNGPGATIIRGAWDPVSTNGPMAVRCAWLGDEVRLGGFTLENGATLNNAGTGGQGGGVLGNSTNAVVFDSIVKNNQAISAGGGAYVTFERSKLLGNRSPTAGILGGGGAFQCLLVNSLIRGNTARGVGGGAQNSRLINCTVVENSAATGGGIYMSYATNCIIYHNLCTPYYAAYANWTGAGQGISFSCTDPLPTVGIGNITADPQILDGQHLAASSPCIGAGSALYATGTDLDQQPWANPPPMGCDQYVEADNVGPLDFTLRIADPIITEARNTRLYAAITGRANRVAWDFGDGSTLTSLSLVSVYHAWTNPGNYTITFTAYNLDNPAGVSKTIGVTVIPLVVPAMSNAGWTSNAFTLGFQSQPGVTYQLQQTTNLAPPTIWTAVKSIVGDGNIQTLTDTAATNQMRFYRLWLQ